MKFIRILATSAALFSLSASAFASHSMTLLAPFDFVKLTSKQEVKVQYQFNAANQVLVCESTPDVNSTRISWQYKGEKYLNSLPITLKDNSQFDGEFADPNGTLKITNNSPVVNVIISCQYKTLS